MSGRSRASRERAAVRGGPHGHDLVEEVALGLDRGVLLREGFAEDDLHLVRVDVHLALRQIVAPRVVEEALEVELELGHARVRRVFAEEDDDDDEEEDELPRLRLLLPEDWVSFVARTRFSMERMHTGCFMSW